MFLYSDPTSSGILEAHEALETYRGIVHSWYRSSSRLPDSAFTLLDAIEAAEKNAITKSTVSWSAFPITALASHDQIDGGRFRFQDEYVEWNVERNSRGQVARVTFTTEFLEFYEALAARGGEALSEAISAVIVGADPRSEDLFGTDFDAEAASAEARAAQFHLHAPMNPWNNGQKGILALSQRFNTMAALFNLAGHCAVTNLDVPAGEVCSSIGGFCGPGRNSDPAVCQAIQNLSLGGNGLTLADPVGVRILKLEGLWRVNGGDIDVNDELNNSGIWKISRNGRRATLDLSQGVTMDGESIDSGAQVAQNLLVGVDVISAANEVLPAWARTGQESSRRIA